jgi:Ankyrin repeats (3 copies)
LVEHLPFQSPLAAYARQAEALLAAHGCGNAAALRLIHEKHPRFLDTEVRWLPRPLTPDDIRAAPFDLAGAQLTIARAYDFLDWGALATYVAEVTQPDSPVARFEGAVEAVVNGDLVTLIGLLAAHPQLVHARSNRVTHFDPPVHRSTLLHYLAANGVEGHRQKTPANAVAIAKALLTAGAEPDSLADLYGGQCTTMSLLVSSCHPASAGLQVALVDTLIDHGASVHAHGTGDWTSPLDSALVFGYLPAAEALVRRGAKVDNLASAAGLGRLEQSRDLLPQASEGDRHRALALAAHLGHAEIVSLLLQAGVDPDRYNPPGLHEHGTPLHHAALAGHLAAVRVLVEHGARLDLKDKLWQATPLGWAAHGKQDQVVAYLRALYSDP